MQRLLVAALVTVAMVSSANAQVSCQTYGNQTFCDNGLNAQAVPDGGPAGQILSEYIKYPVVRGSA